jgi:hypothetical protein
MNIDQDTVYWVLSTVAQVYAALIAVLGALAIYRLNIASEFRRELYHRLIHLFSETLWKGKEYPQARSLSPKEIISIWREEETSTKEKQTALMEEIGTDSYFTIEDEISKLGNSYRHTGILQASIFILTFLFLFFIGASCVGMLYTCELVFFECAFANVLVAAFLISLILIIFYFWVVVADEDKVIKKVKFFYGKKDGNEK